MSVRSSDGESLSADDDTYVDTHQPQAVNCPNDWGINGGNTLYSNDFSKNLL